MNLDKLTVAGLSAPIANSVSAGTSEPLGRVEQARLRYAAEDWAGNYARFSADPAQRPMMQVQQHQRRRQAKRDQRRPGQRYLAIIGDPFGENAGYLAGGAGFGLGHGLGNPLAVLIAQHHQLPEAPPPPKEPPPPRKPPPPQPLPPPPPQPRS